MNLQWLNRIFILISYFMPTLVLAAQPTGFGGTAQTMMEPVVVLSDFVTATCLVIGGSFLFAAIIKYKEHRRSPLMVPISTVVFLVIAGLALIGLPFMWMLGKYVH